MNLLQKLKEAHGVKDNEDDVFDTRNQREPYYDYMMSIVKPQLSNQFLNHSNVRSLA